MADYRRERGVDWPRLIDDLLRLDGAEAGTGSGAGAGSGAGSGPGSGTGSGTGRIGIVQLSRRLEVSWSKLNHYRSAMDTEPRHRTGERIIGRWLRATGRPREELPMRVVITRSGG